MKTLNKKTLIKYSLSSLGFGIISTYFTRDADLLVNIINIFFVSGLFSLTFGLISIIRKFGLFDVFLYSFGLLRAYSRHFKDDPENENPKSYHQYREEKTKHNFKNEPLIIGALFILISGLLLLFTTN